MKEYGSGRSYDLLDCSHARLADDDDDDNSPGERENARIL